MPRDFFENTAEEPPLTAKITLPDGLKPVLFSTDTVEAEKSEAGSTQWILHASGWSLILYAGDYISEHIDAAGVNVEFFYSAKHRRVMEECDVNDTLKQVFEYCTDHYGPLFFYGEEGMRLIEIGATGGGYAAGGASVMGEDSFSEAGLKDPLKGAGGSEVMAHEIIHQWWGAWQYDRIFLYRRSLVQRRADGLYHLSDDEGTSRRRLRTKVLCRCVAVPDR